MHKAICETQDGYNGRNTSPAYELSPDVHMGNDEAALVRLWQEKRGEVDRQDLSGNLVVQLGLATERLNRRWYQANTGRVITDVQEWSAIRPSGGWR
jgi:hypothetical protein